MSSVLLALTSIRSFCRWALREGYLWYDPTLRLSWPKRIPPLPRALIHEQIRLLWQGIEEPPDLSDNRRFHWRRNRRVVVVMLFTGLRIAEAADLRWGDIDLEVQRLVVRMGKNGKSRSVPIHPLLVEELRRAKVGHAPADPVIAQRCSQREPMRAARRSRLT